MKHAGYWCGGKHLPVIEIVETEDGLFALNGWNGAEYTDCWKCVDEWTVDPDDTAKYIARPIYRFMEDEIDLDDLEENSDEWNNAVEIIDYKVQVN